MRNSIVLFGIGLGRSTTDQLADAIVEQFSAARLEIEMLYLCSLRSVRTTDPLQIVSGIQAIEGRKLCIFAHRHDSVGTRPKMLHFYETMEREFHNDPNVDIVILQPIPEPSKMNHFRRCAEVKLAFHR
jgi:hypothetical protein